MVLKTNINKAKVRNHIEKDLSVKNQTTKNFKKLTTQEIVWLIFLKFSASAAMSCP